MFLLFENYYENLSFMFHVSLCVDSYGLIIFQIIFLTIIITFMMQFLLHLW